MKITTQQIMAICPNAKKPKVDALIDKLNEAMIHYQIGTPIRARAFIAQVGHESDEFNAVEEYASGKAYDTGKLAERLGNTPEADGDGQKYKGRGLIQITGLENYRQVSKALNYDFVNKPEDLEKPGPACFSAGWYWDSRNLNKIADLNTDEAFLKITKRINGGTNGLAHRIELHERAKRIII